MSDEELMELVTGHLATGGAIPKAPEAPVRKATVKVPKRRNKLSVEGSQKTLRALMSYKRVTPNPGRLAKKMRLPVSTVRGYLAILEEDQLVERVPKGKRVCYRLL